MSYRPQTVAGSEAKVLSTILPLSASYHEMDFSTFAFRQLAQNTLTVREGLFLISDVSTCSSLSLGPDLFTLQRGCGCVHSDQSIVLGSLIPYMATLSDSKRRRLTCGFVRGETKVD